MPAAAPHYPSAVLRAPCKVNLVLRIEGVRPDGYHELTTLFVPLPEPHDLLTVEPCGFRGLTLAAPDCDCPPEANLVHRAYTAFSRATGIAPGLSVRLAKHIPSGAGLGGGSSDAAALLRYLNAHAGKAALPPEKLAALAARLGADVPFFLRDGPAWATGIGERLYPAEVDLSGCTTLLVCPKVHVSTAWAYGAWDRENTRKSSGNPGQARLTGGFEQGTDPVRPWPPVFENSFEAVVFPAFPVLRQLKEQLFRLGAAACVMSGSGASLVSLFRDAGAAEEAARAIPASVAAVFVIA